MSEIVRSKQSGNQIDRFHLCVCNAPKPIPHQGTGSRGVRLLITQHLKKNETYDNIAMQLDPLGRILKSIQHDKNYKVVFMDIN